MSTESSSFSFVRTLLAAVPLAAVIAGVALMWGKSIQQSATDDMNRTVVQGMLVQLKPEAIDSDFELVDEDGDLLADTPKNAATLQAPKSLVFSYIAEELEEGEDEADFSNWSGLFESLTEATGLPVTTKHFEKVADQLAALRAGEVHMIGLGTGAAPLAVETSGFIPLCTLANAEGEVGYTMQIVTGAKSPVKELGDLAGRSVIFVRPTSNSGFKAAFVLMQSEAGLLPEQDYEWTFSLSHEDSIRAAIDGEADAAPIASDILVKMIDRGDVSEDDFRIVYESEAFPPAVIGCAYNLPPDMIAKIRDAMTGFDWSGTGLEDELGPMGAASFAPVNYKDDWANIRRIDASVARIVEGG